MMGGYAGVAQLVEQLICNQQVAGSSPIASSKIAKCCQVVSAVEILFSTVRRRHLKGGVLNIGGGVPERSKGTDCKSVGNAFGGSNPPPSTTCSLQVKVFLMQGTF